VRVVALGFNLAKRSTDVLVSAAAKDLNSGFVVSEAVLTHAPHCRSAPALGIDKMACLSQVQRILITSRSHDDVVDRVRNLLGVSLEPHDVTRLKNKVEEMLTNVWREDFRYLTTMLAEMEANTRFGAELRVRKDGEGDIKLLHFGVMKPTGYSRPDVVTLRALVWWTSWCCGRGLRTYSAWAHPW
jgi:hypothetical protein